MAEKTIRDFQTDVCDPMEPKEREKICPDCIPNPEAIVPDWRLSEGEPFLNEKTCEYQVAVTINQDGEYYRSAEIREAADKGIDFETLLQSYVLPGLRIMLRYYGKEETDDVVCAFPPSIQNINTTDPLADAATQVGTAAAAGFLFGGPFGAAIVGGISLVKEGVETFTAPAVEIRSDNITNQANRCRSIYTQQVEGTLPKEFHNQVTKKIEVTSGLPDGSTFNIIIPDPVGLLMYQELGTSSVMAGGPDMTINNPDALELYARAVDYTFGDTPGEPMEVLIAIPSYVMNKVPSYVPPTPMSFDGPKEVILNGPRIKAMIARLSEALRVYGNYQAYWWQTEKATLYQKIMLPDGTFVSQTTGVTGMDFSESTDVSTRVVTGTDTTAPPSEDYEMNGNPSIFYIKTYMQAVSNFYIALHDFLEENDFRLTAFPNFLGDRAEEVKIVFEPIPEGPSDDSPDGSGTNDLSGHFTIKSVWAKYNSCGWKACKAGMGKFKNHASVRDQTVMGYISNLAVIDEQLMAKTTPPWLDFIVEHTYPPLDVRYSSEANSVQGKVSALGCILDGQPEAFRDWIFDSIMSLGDAVAYQFNKNSCKLLTDPSFRPSEKKWSDWRETQRQKQLDQINRHYAEEQRQLRVKGTRISEKSYTNEAERQRDLSEIENLQKYSESAQAQALDHPYRSAAIDAALQEFDMDSSLLGLFIDQAELRKVGLGKSIWKDFNGILGGRKKSKFELFKNRMDKCGLNIMLVKAIECLMGGVTLEAAFEAIVKAALRALDNADWEVLFVGLPYHKQLEIKEIIENKVGNLPPPWEWAPGKNSIPDEQDMETVGLDNKLRSNNKQIKINDEKIKELKSSMSDLDAYSQSLQLTLDEEIKKGVKNDSLEAEINSARNDMKDIKQRIDDRTRQNVKLKKFENKKTNDKAYKDLKKLKPEDLQSIRTDIERYQASLGHDPQNRWQQGTVGGVLGDINQAIFDIYIDTLIEVWGVDNLLNTLEKFPGVKFLVNAIRTWDCPYPPMFSPPAGNFLSSLSLSLCNGVNVGKLSLPKMMGFGNISFMNLLKVLWTSLMKAVIQTAFDMLVTMIVKILQILESAICKAIELAGRLTANALTPGDQGGFQGAIADVFCGPAASEEDKQATSTNLLSALGVTPSNFAGMNSSDLAGSHAEVAQTISSVSTRNDIKSLIVMDPRDHDPNVIRRISKAVSVVNPEYAPIFSDPNNVSQIFASAGNLLTPTQIGAIRDELDAPEDDVPLDDSICLTKQELDQWNQDRINLFTDAGLPEDLARDWVQKQNDKAKTDLIEVCSIAARGVDGPLSDEIEKLIDFENAMGDPDCLLNNSAVSFRTPELDAIDEQAAGGVFRGLTKNFQRDLTGGGWIFGRYGVVDHILADTWGLPLRAHEMRTRMTFLYPSWANSQPEYDNRKSRIAASLGLPEDVIEWFVPEDAKGVFPETIGIQCKETLQSASYQYSPNFSYTPPQVFSGKRERFLRLDYLFTYTKPALKEPDLVYEFRDAIEGDVTKFSYGFDLSYHSFIIKDTNAEQSVSNSFEYDIRLTTILNKDYSKTEEEEAEEMGIELPPPGEPTRIETLRMRVTNPIDSSRKSLISDLQISETDLAAMKYTYEGLLWWKHCQSQWSDFGVSLSKDLFADKVWTSVSNKMFKDVIDLMVEPNGEISPGYKYGYSSDSSVTFEDLLYVDPEATDDKNTWQYTYDEDEKVLGKSATDNPRVHFLDPEIHGGYYSWPKVYIDRFEYDGVLGAIQLMVPDIDGCQPKRTDFLDWKYLADRQKTVKNKMIPDKRLQFEEECVKKIPFDLVQTNDIHGFIEAAVLATIRTYISEFILKALPIVTSLEFNEHNFDDAVAQLIIEYMEQDMPNRGGWLDWTWIKRYDYWLHFLEQCYQIVHRRVKMKELKAKGAIKKAIDEVTEAQRRHVYISGDIWDRLENSVSQESLPYLEKKHPEKVKDLYPQGKHPFRGRYVLASSDPPRPEDADYQIMAGAKIIYFGKDAENITRYAKSGQDQYYDGFEYNFKALGFTKRHARRCSKIYTIHSMRNQAKIMLKHLVQEELKNYSEKIAESLTPEAKITSLARYYIGGSNSVINGGLKSGTVEVEKARPATVEATGEEVLSYLESPGTCLDVSRDIHTHNPLDDESYSDISNGQFVVEKYVRIIDKPEEESEDVPDFIKNRPDNLKGVVNIEEFRKFVNENMLENPLFNPDEYGISDLFGDAELLRDLQERPTGMVGSIGFKFGVRISFIPPSGFVAPPVSEANLEIAQREKAYYLKSAGDPMTSHIFPIASFEKDILDDKVSKIDWQHQHFGEEIRCYIDNLVDTPEFKLIFDNIFPLRRASSLVALYTYHGWFAAIGNHETERKWEFEGGRVTTINYAGKDDTWREGLFDRTKDVCYKMFHGFYESDSWDWGWDWSFDFNFRLWFKDRIPGLFTNLDPSVRWWQRWRIEQNRPFDKDGENCGNVLGNLFSWF